MGEAMSAERANCSALIGSRNIALPLLDALAWATTTNGAKASRSAPVSCMYRRMSSAESATKLIPWLAS